MFNIICDEKKLKTICNITNEKMYEIFGDKLISVILYGSYARGDYEDFSDIDIMALVDMEKLELGEYRRKVSSFSSDIGLEYDVLLSIKLQDKKTFDEWQNVLPFFMNVKKEGIVISA